MRHEFIAEMAKTVKTTKVTFQTCSSNCLSLVFGKVYGMIEPLIKILEYNEAAIEYDSTPKAIKQG